MLARGAKAPQMFLFTSAGIFLLVLFHRLATTSGMLPDTTIFKDNLAASLGGGHPLEAIMERSEKLWEKTVRQRREMRNKNYQDQDIGL